MITIRGYAIKAKQAIDLMNILFGYILNAETCPLSAGQKVNAGSLVGFNSKDNRPCWAGQSGLVEDICFRRNTNEAIVFIRWLTNKTRKSP